MDSFEFCYNHIKWCIIKRGENIVAKTSVEVKERYNKKTYEDIRLRVKKGEKEIIQNRANELNKSINGYITDLIEEDLKKANVK